ncbi:unnamed protein product [Lepidochelys kempii]
MVRNGRGKQWKLLWASAAALSGPGRRGQGIWKSSGKQGPLLDVPASKKQQLRLVLCIGKARMAYRMLISSVSTFPLPIKRLQLLISVTVSSSSALTAGKAPKTKGTPFSSTLHVPRTDSAVHCTIHYDIWNYRVKQKEENIQMDGVGRVEDFHTAQVPTQSDLLTKDHTLPSTLYSTQGHVVAE